MCHYDNFKLTRDLISETTENGINYFCNIYNLQDIVKLPLVTRTQTLTLAFLDHSHTLSQAKFPYHYSRYSYRRLENALSGM